MISHRILQEITESFNGIAWEWKAQKAYVGSLKQGCYSNILEMCVGSVEI